MSQERKRKMADINPTISIITVNVNRLNNSIKRKKLSDRIKENKIQTHAVYERHTLDSKIQTG